MAWVAHTFIPYSWPFVSLRLCSAMVSARCFRRAHADGMLISRVLIRRVVEELAVLQLGQTCNVEQVILNLNSEGKSIRFLFCELLGKVFLGHSSSIQPRKRKLEISVLFNQWGFEGFSFSNYFYREDWVRFCGLKMRFRRYWSIQVAFKRMPPSCDVITRCILHGWGQVPQPFDTKQHRLPYATKSQWAIVQVKSAPNRRLFLSLKQNWASKKKLKAVGIYVQGWKLCW